MPPLVTPPIFYNIEEVFRYKKLALKFSSPSFIIVTITVLQIWLVVKLSDYSLFIIQLVVFTLQCFCFGCLKTLNYCVIYHYLTLDESKASVESFPKYDWPSKNMGLNCVGLLICGFYFNKYYGKKIWRPLGIWEYLLINCIALKCWKN